MNAKKTLFFLIITFLLPYVTGFFSVYGQEKGEIPPVKTDTLFIQQLVDSIKFSDAENAKTYKKALTNMQVEAALKANEFSKLGNYFYKEKLYAQAIEYIDEAILFLDRSDDYQSLYNLHTLKGNAYLLSWKYVEALDAYYKALELNRNFIRNEIYEAIINTNIAIVYRKTGQLYQAKNVYRTTLNFIEKSKIKHKKTHVKVLSEISFLHIDLEEYDSVISYANQGLKISKAKAYHDEIGNFYTARGIVFYHQEEYDQSLENLIEAEDFLYKQTVPEKRYIINNSCFIAKCYYAQQNYQLAIDKMDRILSLIDEDEFNAEAIEVYNVLAKSNKALGDDDSAIYWYEKSIELDKASEKQKDLTINKILSKEKRDYNQEISLLMANKSKLTILLLIIVFVLLATSLFYIKKQQLNKRIFNKLIDRIQLLETIRKEKKEHSAIVNEISIDDDKINKVLTNLAKLESQHYFLDVNCNLRSMAKKVKTNTTYLSKIINRYKKKNFNDYINDLRIDYVLDRLKNDKTFRLFSIKSIATDIGYKSDYSFAKHFKAKTGINPSYYIKELNKLEV